MASLGLGVVTEPAVAELLRTPLGWVGVGTDVAHGIAVVAALTIVVFLHMVIGEIVPKNIALTDPESTLVRVTPLNRVYLAVFRPSSACSTMSATSACGRSVSSLATSSRPRHTADDTVMLATFATRRA